MITKPVKITQWPRKGYVDGFVYMIVTANGHGIAEISTKGEGGLKNAEMIRDAINEYLDLGPIHCLPPM